MKTRLKPELYVPVALAAFFAVLVLLGATRGLENGVYDAFLHLRPGPAESRDILLIDIDDRAVARVGTWPVARTVIADGLMLLGEFGADQAVFDIEYVDKSPRGVNQEVLSEEIPELLSNEFSSIANNVQGLVEAVARGSLPAREARAFAKDLGDLVDASRRRVDGAVGRIARDNDEYLAGAARFFGKTYFTVNMQDSRDDSVSPELRALVAERFGIKGIDASARPLAPKTEIKPAIEPIARAAAGLGFPNVVVDPDGVRRRISLVQRFGDAYFPQLVLAPVLARIGDPKVKLHPGGLVLVGARMPDGWTGDIRVPFDARGNLVIDWPHKKFLDSFRHLSFDQLVAHDETMATLVYNLKIRAGWGYLDLYSGERPLLDIWAEAEALRAEIMAGREPASRKADYRALRDLFMAEVGAFLAAKPEAAIAGAAAAVAADPAAPAETKAEYAKIGADAPAYFAEVAKLHANLAAIRADLDLKVKGSLGIIGHTATGSTDIGVNPFDSSYSNVGTHASVANTILQRRFIDEAPAWASALATLVLTLLLVYLLRDAKPAVVIAVGAVAALGIAGAAALLFVATGLYFPLVAPLAAVATSFLFLAGRKFLAVEKEKGFIRSAFSHYLSEEVIKDIVGNPGKLKLGGEARVMTALFTDIKGFSTVSEKLTATELVHLLNEYLSTMSDIILGLKGTIDKYEGDAIISFFGAPLELPDHALRACQAAIRMKKAEAALNARFLAEGISPAHLLTRVGINSGEMVVGNMGTIRKMDYTVIGDSVNLAARLEGVNKQYGTWLCVSEDTRAAAGDAVVVRRLDRVRVVGKQQAIRIYELVDEKGLLEDRVAEVLGRFEESLELFENRDWAKAAAGFERVLALSPEDGPAGRYLKLAREYQASPPPASWDGVFVLTSK